MESMPPHIHTNVESPAFMTTRVMARVQSCQISYTGSLADRSRKNETRVPIA